MNEKTTISSFLRICLLDKQLTLIKLVKGNGSVESFYKLMEEKTKKLQSYDNAITLGEKNILSRAFVTSVILVSKESQKPQSTLIVTEADLCEFVDQVVFSSDPEFLNWRNAVTQLADIPPFLLTALLYADSDDVRAKFPVIDTRWKNVFSVESPNAAATAAAGEDRQRFIYERKPTNFTAVLSAAAFRLPIGNLICNANKLKRTTKAEQDKLRHFPDQLFASLTYCCMSLSAIPNKATDACAIVKELLKSDNSFLALSQYLHSHLSAGDIGFIQNMNGSLFDTIDEVIRYIPNSLQFFAPVSANPASLTLAFHKINNQKLPASISADEIVSFYASLTAILGAGDKAMVNGRKLYQYLTSKNIPFKDLELFQTEAAVLTADIGALFCESDAVVYSPAHAFLRLLFRETNTPLQGFPHVESHLFLQKSLLFFWPQSMQQTYQRVGNIVLMLLQDIPRHVGRRLYLFPTIVATLSDSGVSIEDKFRLIVSFLTIMLRGNKVVDYSMAPSSNIWKSPSEMLKMVAKTLPKAVKALFPTLDSGGKFTAPARSADLMRVCFLFSGVANVKCTDTAKVLLFMKKAFAKLDKGSENAAIVNGFMTDIEKLGTTFSSKHTDWPRYLSVLVKTPGALELFLENFVFDFEATSAESNSNNNNNNDNGSHPEWNTKSSSAPNSLFVHPEKVKNYFKSPAPTASASASAAQTQTQTQTKPPPPIDFDVSLLNFYATLLCFLECTYFKIEVSPALTFVANTLKPSIDKKTVSASKFPIVYLFNEQKGMYYNNELIIMPHFSNVNDVTVDKSTSLFTGFDTALVNLLCQFPFTSEVMSKIRHFQSVAAKRGGDDDDDENDNDNDDEDEGGGGGGAADDNDAANADFGDDDRDVF